MSSYFVKFFGNLGSPRKRRQGNCATITGVTARQKAVNFKRIDFLFIGLTP